MKKLLSKISKCVILLLLACLLVMFASGCSSEMSDAPQLLDPVGNQEQTYTVTRCDIAAHHSNSDVSISAKSMAAYFEGGGYVGNLAVSIGDTVKKGDLIAALDDPGLSEQYESVVQQIDALQKNHSFAIDLLNCDLEIEKLKLQQMTEQNQTALELQKQQLAIEEAMLSITHCKEQYRYDLAELTKKRDDYKLRMEHNKLYAPMSGRVSYLPDTSKGRVYLTDTTPCAIIADDTALTIRMRYITDAKAYDTYTHYTALIDGTEYPLTLQQPTAEEYAAAVKSGKEVYTAFTFTNGVPQGVGTATIATVHLYYYEAKDVLAVPYHALQYDGEYYSLDVERDGKRMVRRVTVGQVTSTQAVILEGLQEGDIVYV